MSKDLTKDFYSEKAKNKKVAICGTAPTVANTPFNDPEFDIWGVAHCSFLDTVTRMDMIFEIHKREIWKKDNAPFHRFPNAVIILQDKDEGLPNSIGFPTEYFLNKYAVNKGFSSEKPYMSSSLPFMIALAIEKGYEEIHLYGIHLSMEEEYFYQRPCLERYIGIAEGKGIKVFTDPGADIMQFGYVYGIQETEADSKIQMWKGRLDEFDKRIAGLNQQLTLGVQNLKDQINQLMGAREEVIHNLRYYGKDVRNKEYVKF